MSARPALTTTITGYVARDAELKFTQSGRPVANFTIPYTPRRRDDATGQWVDAGDSTWVRVSVWGDDAEIAAQHATKGTLMTVEGRPQVRTWTGRDGTTHAEMEINAQTWAVHPRTTSGGGGQGGGTWPTSGAQQRQDPWGAGRPLTDEPPF